MNSEEKARQIKEYAIREWFLLITVIGLFCCYMLSKVGEPSLHSVLFGFSASRLLMMAVLLICSVISLLGLFSKNSASAFGPIIQRKSLVYTLTILFLIFSMSWLFLGFIAEERLHPYFERLQPLLLYGIFTCGSGVITAFRLREHTNQDREETTEIRKLATSFFYIALALYLFIRITGTGIIPDEMDWQPNGMAIHYWEIGISLWLALSLTILLRLFRAYRKQMLTTVLIFLAIWIASAVLWVSVPTMEVLDHSYFMEITAPNNLPYPASDAAYYGLWSESILAGLGFKSNVVTRQFLIVMIAFFEKLTNDNILKTIDCFTILLALIPACIYLLGKRLHSHGAGILAAGLAAFREYNTIKLAPLFMVSSSKMLLSDLPGMLCILAALSAAISWFQKPKSTWRMLLAGCLTGLAVTVRSQSIILIPFIALVFLLRKNDSFRERLFPALGFLLAAAMVIAPWLIRSKIITGDFLLDEPGIHSTELARRWSDDVNNEVTREQDESDAEYASKNAQHMLDFFLEKPLYVTDFISSHFFANEICALTALPFGTDFNLTIRDVTNTDFHNVESRMLDRRNVLILAVFLAFIVFGISAAQKRGGTAGLLPFYMCTLYLLLTAAGRYSGWRFALPADWVYYFYFSIGIMEAGYQIAAALGGKKERLLSYSQLDRSEQQTHPAAAIGIILIFLALGCAPAFSGKIIPQQLTTNNTDENILQIKSLIEHNPDPAIQLDDLPVDGNKTIINGRIIYPRFFYANQGLASGHPWTAYKIRDYSRLGFVLLNEENHDVILPVSESPAYIPNAADAYIIGTEDTEEGFFRADTIIILSADHSTVIRVLTAARQE